MLLANMPHSLARVGNDREYSVVQTDASVVAGERSSYA
jgi:hypothetical protein